MTVVVPLIPFKVAVAVVVPTATPVTWPAVPAALEMLAMELARTVHATWAVRSWVVPFW